MLRAWRYLRNKSGFIGPSRKMHSASHQPRLKNYIKQGIVPFIISFELMHLLLQHGVRIRHANGPSMLPTLAIEELVFEENIRHEYFPQTLQRGCLVSFLSPLDPNMIVCKRILGLPGDVILVDPTVLPAPPPEGMATPVGRHVVVPPGHIWVQGDNAAASRDSRLYGPIPISLIRGRLICGISLAPGPTTFKWYNQSLTEFP